MKNLVNVKEKEGSSYSKINHREARSPDHSLWFIIFTICFLATWIGLPFSFSTEGESASGGERGALVTIGHIYCLKEVSAEPEIKVVSLKNGFKVLLKEDHDTPLVSLLLCVLTGSAREGEFSGSGIAHFTEHMLFKGTRIRKKGTVFKEIEGYGGKINAFTSYDYTGYEVIIPSEFTNNALELLADISMNASFVKEELEKERQVILKEIRLNYDNPQRRISRMLWQAAFSEHSYKYPVIGEKELLNDLKRKDLIRFYQTRYTPENMILAVVGDINSNEIATFINDIFGDFNRRGISYVESIPEPKQKTIRQQEERFTSGLTYLLLGYHSVALNDADCFALDMLGTILGQGKSSRLYKLIVDKKRLAYGISAVNYTPRDPGLMIIRVSLEEADKKRALALIFKQIKLLQKKLVYEKELARAKNQIISDILFQNQTVQAQARDLALNEAITGDFNFTQAYIKKIQEVTSEDILTVANKYLTEKNLTIVALLPKDKNIKAKLNIKATPPSEIGIENLSPQTSSPIQKYTLANGVIVLIKEKHDLPLVSIKAVFKGGLHAEDEQTNGLSNLFAQMLAKGTKDKDAAEIAELIESRGARISSFSGNNSFGLSLEAQSKDFDSMLSLFAELLKDSTFPTGELRKQKNKNLAQIKVQEDSIFETGIKELKVSLFTKHPYRFTTIGSEKSLKNLKRKNLLTFQQNLCVGNNMVLAIFGDVDQQYAANKVRKLFGSIDSGAPYNVLSSHEPISKEVRKEFKQLDKQQSLVLFGFRGTDVLSPDRYPLELICQVLANPSGKLFTQIREEAGLAYAVGAYPVLGLDPGYIVLYAATTKDNVERVQQKVLEELKLLKRSSLTSEELMQAKRSLIGKQLINRQTNSAQAIESSLDELYGLGFNNYRNYVHLIENITLEDVQSCAKRYFDLTNYSLIVTGPK